MDTGGLCMPQPQAVTLMLHRPDRTCRARCCGDRIEASAVLPEGDVPLHIQSVLGRQEGVGELLAVEA